MTTKDTLIAIKNKGFDKQRAVFSDKSKRIALFVGRRSGKTTTIAILFLLLALMHKRIRLVFIGLTGEGAENAFCPAIEKELRDFKMHKGQHWVYNNTERTYTFLDTGSTISLKGYDTSYKEMDKILGGKCFAVAIDECQSQTQDIEKAILYKIQPAVSDYLPQGGGQIILAGTAGDYMGQAFWYRLTTDPSHLGWSFYHWLDKENPHMLQAKLLEDKQFEDMYGKDFREEQDWYKQQYLCVWEIGEKSRVYQYDKDKNNLTDAKLCQELSAYKSNYVYILGIDLGHNDALAMVLSCYGRHDGNYYIVASEKFYKLNDLGVFAQRLQYYRAKYNITHYTIDSAGSGKLIVEDFRRRYRIPFMYPKSKTDKQDFIRQMNSDFVSGKIKVIAANNKELIEEWQTLLLDREALEEGYKKEADKYHNDACDAALYGYSIAKHFGWTPAAPVQDYSSPMREETEKQWAAKQSDKANADAFYQEIDNIWEH